MTPERLVRLYDRIYRASHTGGLRHPTKGRLGRYGEGTGRDEVFAKYISSKLSAPKMCRVLDASCGRGDLAARLMKCGFDVEVSEVSPWLVRNVLEKRGFSKVHLLTYEQLDRLPERSFDCVVSNDVLEHLADERRAEEAVASLARLSRQLLCVSVGMGRAPNIPEAMGLGIRSLHCVVKPAEWWLELFERHATTDTYRATRRTTYLFGVVK